MSACSAVPPRVEPGASAGFGGLVIRHPNADPASAASAAVEVRDGAAIVFVSGQTPEPAARDAPRFSASYWGSTEAQGLSVFAKIDSRLQSLGLSLGDIVKMQVFLVADPEPEGRADLAGFARAYARHFGTATQPLRPARTTLQVAALGAPGMLVEIDVIAARR